MEQYIEKEKFSPPRCAELLRRFEEKEALHSGEKLRFSGVGGKDVYNITAPFSDEGKTYIAGRVESRDTEIDSQVRFFEEINGVWRPAPKTPTFVDFQDPFVTKVESELIFGGIKISGFEKFPKDLDYCMEFFRGKNLQTLEKFAEGPAKMKGVRIVSLANGRIGVFTRPQGEQNGRGKIGYVELDALKDLNAQNILNARVIENQFDPEEWGGVNELHLLHESRIGVIGHIAYQDGKNVKSYYAMSFVYDPKTHRASPIEIIATRNNFPPGDAKKEEFANIVYPSNLVRHGDGTATLYAGLSDSEAGSIQLPDPFSGK